MRVVNRAVVIVKPKQPFLDWLGSLPDPADISLDDLREDSTAFLISDSGAEHFDRWLRRNYQTIFQEQLWGWWTGEADWPAQRDLRTFRAWFDVEGHSLVIDLDARGITHEDL